MPEITDDPAPLADIIRAYIIAVCELCDWNLRRVANVLGVAEKTIYNHLHRYEEQGYVAKNMKGKGWQLKRRAAA